MDQKMLLKQQACKTSPSSLCLTAVTYLFLVRAMEQLSTGPTAPQHDHEPGAATERRRTWRQDEKTRHIHVFFFQLAFLAAPAALRLPMQDVIIQEGVSYATGSQQLFSFSSLGAEFLCSESAPQELSFASLQCLVSH